MATSNLGPISGEDFLKLVAGTHNNIADGNPTFWQVGGKYVGTPTAVANGDLAAAWLNAYGYQVPERQNIQIGSFTTASATTTANIGSITGLGAFKEGQVYIDVTGTGGTASTLTVFVDSRLDGTNWVNIGASTLMTTASRQIINLTKRQSNGVAILTGNAGAGTVRAAGWADDIQLRHTIEGTTANFTYTVWVNTIA